MTPAGPAISTVTGPVKTSHDASELLLRSCMLLMVAINCL
jgi:hypothetical protein